MTSSPATTTLSRTPAAMLCGVMLCVATLFAGVPVIGAAKAQAQMIEPVDGTLIDPFRPPAHIGGPGNRGWEYRTTPGSPALVVAEGVVVFAGPIGGRNYVSVDHGGGLRTTYSLLVTVGVVAGTNVAAGQQLGTTGATFHFGVRRGGVYVDPASLFGVERLQVRLVPRPPSTAVGGPRAVSVSWWREYTLRLARSRVE